MPYIYTGCPKKRGIMEFFDISVCLVFIQKSRMGKIEDRKGYEYFIFSFHYFYFGNIKHDITIPLYCILCCVGPTCHIILSHWDTLVSRYDPGPPHPRITVILLTPSTSLPSTDHPDTDPLSSPQFPVFVCVCVVWVSLQSDVKLNKPKNG